LIAWTKPAKSSNSRFASATDCHSTVIDHALRPSVTRRSATGTFARACGVAAEHGYTGIRDCPVHNRPTDYDVSASVVLNCDDKQLRPVSQLSDCIGCLPRRGIPSTSPDAAVRATQRRLPAACTVLPRILGGDGDGVSAPADSQGPGITPWPKPPYSARYVLLGCCDARREGVTLRWSPSRGRGRFLTTCARNLRAARSTSGTNAFACIRRQSDTITSDGAAYSDLIRRLFGTQLAHFHANTLIAAGPASARPDFRPILPIVALPRLMTAGSRLRCSIIYARPCFTIGRAIAFVVCENAKNNSHDVTATPRIIEVGSLSLGCSVVAFGVVSW